MRIKNYLLAVGIILLSAKSYSQESKPFIPITGPDKWSHLGYSVISKSGNFVMYAVETQIKDRTVGHKLILTSSNGKWKSEFSDVINYSAKFSEDERYALIQSIDGNLFRINLKTKAIEKIKGFDKAVSQVLNPAPEKYTFFNKNEPLPEPNSLLPEVDVWNYRDSEFPNPWRERKKEMYHTYVRNEVSKQTFQLTNDKEQLISINGDLAIVAFNDAPSSAAERYWNEKALSSYYLVSLETRERMLIMKEGKEGTSVPLFSPYGRFVVLSNDKTCSFSCFDTKSKMRYDISKGVDISLRGSGHMDTKYVSSDITFISDSVAIAYDDYDLWKLDLTGQNEPLNLTKGYGRAHGIVFRPQGIMHDDKVTKLRKESNGYLLNAFDVRDKSWGFYKLTDLKGSDPILLSKGQHYYGGESATIYRAKNAAVYLVKRETASTSPNLFLTKDFIKFTPLSNIHPEKEYNWVNAELVRWQIADGRSCDGILYKPENFNPNKKYPVVTIVYEDFTRMINRFPDFFNRVDIGYVNILPATWLASNEYLVFIPDLSRRLPGKILKDTYNMLVPGIQYLSNLPYVNSSKIGIQGTSWGGVQVNYLITQTNLFAAAHSAAGESEQISNLGFSDVNMRNNYMLDRKQTFGGLFTEVPQNYVDQSALFHADKVTTPVLFRHNIIDGAVPFYQSLQYFRLLRRLGKRCWFLQYDGSDHGVKKGKNLDDYNLRISQFFDHYLKDKPAPKWMTQGIPPDLKQVETGLELDPGVEP